MLDNGDHMNRLIPLALILALPFPAYADITDDARRAHIHNEPLIIWDNPGGRLVDFNLVRYEMRKGLKVQIVKRCASACTLLLAEKNNLCYEPNTTFAFHGYSTQDGTLSDRKLVERTLSALPPKLAAVLKQEGALDDPDRIIGIKGTYMAKLDWNPRFCEGTAP